MHPTTWKASGHVDAFNDPLIDNKDSKKRYRADVLIEDRIGKIEAKIAKDVAKAEKALRRRLDKEQFLATNGNCVRRQGIDDINARFKTAMEADDLDAVKQLILDLGIKDPETGSARWTDVRQFNLMFKTSSARSVAMPGSSTSARRRRRAFSSTSSTSRSPAA